MNEPDRYLCVFCGSSPGARSSYATAAEELGAEMVSRGYGLVYGGGGIGLMRVVADAVLEGGGDVVGVIPRGLVEREVAHHDIPDLRVVDTMHERKALMAELAAGFVALPGGLGTLEELMETATWGQLGIHSKPCGILDVDGYFQGLLQFLDHAVRERFLRPEHRKMLIVEENPRRLLDRLAGYRGPETTKWLDRDSI